MRKKLIDLLTLVRLRRPEGWLLLLWPTLSALWISSQGWPGWHLLVVFVLGTVLMRSAGCCVNDVADRDFDRHVKRTAGRPVTNGRVSVREALVFGGVLAILAFSLVLTTTPAAVVWSLPAICCAVVYPYAKRYLSMPQAVLGFAFSFGIPIAFAAVQTVVPLIAWALVVSNVLWVMAYDTVYAMVDRDDDLHIGIKTSAITLGRMDVPGVMLFYLLGLALWAGALWPHLGGIWLGFSLLMALVQVSWHYLLIRHRTREGCLRAFFVNHWLGFTQFIGVVGSHWQLGY